MKWAHTGQAGSIAVCVFLIFSRDPQLFVILDVLLVAVRILIRSGSAWWLERSKWNGKESKRVQMLTASSIREQTAKNRIVFVFHALGVLWLMPRHFQSHLWARLWTVLPVSMSKGRKLFGLIRGCKRRNLKQSYSVCSAELCLAHVMRCTCVGLSERGICLLRNKGVGRVYVTEKFLSNSVYIFAPQRRIHDLGLVIFLPQERERRLGFVCLQLKLLTMSLSSPSSYPAIKKLLGCLRFAYDDQVSLSLEITEAISICS